MRKNRFYEGFLQVYSGAAAHIILLEATGIFTPFSLVCFWFVALIFLNHKASMSSLKKTPTGKNKYTLGSCTKCLKVKNKYDIVYTILIEFPRLSIL